MDLFTFVTLVVAGVGTGLIGYLTGLASIVSYPALLSAGLSPVAANVTNTLGLVGIGAGAAVRSSAIALNRGRRHLGQQVIVSALGGVAGAALLLLGGEGSFEAIVPWLIILASVALIFSKRIKQLGGGQDAPIAAYLTGLFIVSVYGGYFGAGSGTIYLALALIATSEPFERAMILKSVLLAVSNLVAALIFIAFGPVNWWAALALGIGCLVGGNLGPLVQRLLPETVMRWIVAVAGFGLAVWLWTK